MIGGRFGQVQSSVIVFGLRMLADRLQTECDEAKARGEWSRTHESLLSIINGGADGPGLIARIEDGHKLITLDPHWEPIGAAHGDTSNSEAADV